MCNFGGSAKSQWPGEFRKKKLLRGTYFKIDLLKKFKKSSMVCLDIKIIRNNNIWRIKYEVKENNEKINILEKNNTERSVIININ